MKRPARGLLVLSFSAAMVAACAPAEDAGTDGAGGSSATGGTGAGGTGTGGRAGTGGSEAAGSGGARADAGAIDAGGSGTGGAPSVGTGGAVVAGTGGVLGTGGARVNGTGGAGVGGVDGGSRDGGPGMDGAAGGGDASSGFAPCPTNGDPCKILPFGDSITFGLLAPDYSTPKEGGYRAELFTRAVNASQKITFVGSQTSGPTTVAGQPFPQKNEGHSGWTIDPISGSPGGISTLVPSPAFDGSPHIVLLMIGTNDSGKISAQTMATDLGALIDKIITTAPNALLAVAKIPPLATAQATINSYNGMIPALVQTRAAAGKHIIMVDQSTLTAADLGDGVHPNAGGYVKMGDTWYEAIKTYLR